VAYNFQTLSATKGAHVRVVYHSTVFILNLIKLPGLHFHIPLAVLFCSIRFENYGQRKPDNNLESPCITLMK
jgi:hypothetical protein